MRSLLLYIVFFFVSLQMYSQVLITKNDTLAIENDTVQLTIPSYTGSVQWQYSVDALTWEDIAGATSQIFTTNAKGKEGYYRAKVTYSYCVPAYSAIAQIKSIPSKVETVSVTNVTETSVTFKGLVTNDINDASIVARGFILSSTNPVPDSKDIIIISGSGLGTFTKNYTTLSSGTTYYVRAFALENNTTIYGEVISFTTKIVVIKTPEITTDPATNITQTSATISATLTTFSNQTTILSKGFYWTTNASDPGDRDYTIDAGSGNGNFTAEIADLADGTTVYYRAFAYYEGGEIVGDILSFTTSIINAPIVTTLSASNLTQTSAYINGTLSAESGTIILTHGFYWSETNAIPTSNDYNIVLGNGLTEFTADITSLTPSTTYYYRAYASYQNGEVLGDVMSFTTSAVVVVQPPVVSTLAASNLTQTTATINASVTADIGTTVNFYGFYWSSTNAIPTSSDNNVVVGTGTGSFYKNLVSLTAGATYYYRAYASYQDGIVLGDVMSFTTNQIVIQPPVVTTLTPTSITDVSVSLNGNVSTDGATVVLSSGFYWSATNTSPTSNDNIISSSTTTGNFTESLSSLTPATTYYYRVFATYANGEVLGDVITFTSNNKVEAPPVVTTETASNITESTATISGNITTDGITAVLVNGFYWSVTNQIPTKNDNVVVIGNGAGDISKNMVSLTPETTYYYRAFATYSGGTIVGDVMSFTTSEVLSQIPEVTTVEANTITVNSAVLVGEVYVEAAVNITERGFYWSASNQDPDSGDNTISSGSGTGSFSNQLASLDAATTYFFKAFAVYDGGTIATGSVISFTTSAIVVTPPVVTTLSATSVTESSAILNASVSSGENATILSNGFYISSVNADPSADDVVVYLSGTSGNFSSVQEDLLPNTVYYVKAFSIYQEATVTGNVIKFTTLKHIVIPPVVTTIDASDISNASAILNANIVSVEAPIISRGFYWSTVNTNPNSNNNVVTVTGTTGSMSALIGNLNELTTIYFKAFVVYSDGIVTGQTLSFTTEQTPIIAPVFSATTVTNITYQSATLNGTLSDAGNSQIFAYGFYWSTTNPEPSGNDNVVSGTYTSPSFSYNFQGLSASTTYYIKVFVMYSEGTVTGDVISFTTAAPPVVLPTVSTMASTNVSYDSAVLNGLVNSAGNQPILSCGFYWSSTNSNPSETDNEVTLSYTDLAFTATLSGLNELTTYYYKAFVTTAQGTVTGNVIQFTTSAIPVIPPTILTLAASSITYNSATLNGQITDVGNSTILGYGFYYSATNANPSSADNSVSLAYTTNNFAKSVVSLNAETIYYYRAYVIYSDGIITGDVLTFTTAALPVVPPTVTTLVVTNITDVSAVLNAEIISAQTLVTSRGFYWSSTNSNPTANDNVVTVGSGTGVYNYTLSGLSAATTYYIKAFAQYSTGIAVGSVQTFTSQVSTGELFIQLNGSTISTNSTTAIINGSTIIVTSGGDYKVSGTLDDGQIIVNSADITDVTLTLDGVDITNSTSAGIYVTSANNANIVLAEGSTNYITDAAVYQFPSADQKEPNAAIFSADDLLISGTGTLIVDGNYKDGISTNDELSILSGIVTVTAANNALVGKDNVEITGGTITLTSGSDGIKSDNATDINMGYVTITGGNIDITATGDGISAETYVYIVGSTIDITAGGGSNANITDTLSHRGIKADEITIVSGNITIDAAGEALKSGTTVTISGGTTKLTSAKEGIDANGKVSVSNGSTTIISDGNSIYSDTEISISGGEITVTSQADGINTLGLVTITEGILDLTTQDQGINADSTITVVEGDITINSAFDGIKGGDKIQISGGTFDVSVGGGCTKTYSDTLSRNGIESNNNIVISGGTFKISVAGDGINSKDDVIISNGTIEICAGDDGINGNDLVKIAGGTIIVNSVDHAVYSSSNVSIEDGKLTSNNDICSGNTTSTGILTVSGGTVIITITTNDSKGIKSNGAMTLSGGNITINASGGVTLNTMGSGFDPSYCTAIKCDTDITVSGSTITITHSGTAGKGISSNSNIIITSGTVNVTTTGNGSTYKNSTGTTDAYSATCMSADGNITITNGTLTFSSSGTAGKGINCDGTLTIGESAQSPTINVTTTGSSFTVSGTNKSLPKAMKATTAAVINNGTITIKSTDDAIKSDNSITINNGTLKIINSVEGLEAKYITVNGGYVFVSSSNDGINATAGLVAGGDNGNDGSLFKVTGGTVIAEGADAVDSNGSIEQTGGTMLVNQNSGLTGFEEGYDFNGTYTMNGGYSFGAGGNSFMIQAMSANSSQNNLFITTTSQVAANSFFRIQDSNGNDIITFKLPYGGYKFMFSSSALTTGATYTLYTGGNYSGGTNSDNLYKGGTYSGGTLKKTFTISSRVTNVTF